MGFIQATKNYFLKWVDFDTRSPRSEYWWGTLGATLVSIALGFILGVVAVAIGIATDFDMETVGNFLTIPLQIFLMIAGVALGVRRLHDLNKSGWWVLLYFTIVGVPVVIYWCCLKGDDGKNRFGSDPLEVPETAATT